MTSASGQTLSTSATDERSPAPPTAGSSGTLFGLQGRQLTRLGAALLIVGIVLFLGSTLPAFLSMSQFTQNPFGSFGSIMGAFFLSFVLGAVGIVLIGAGAFVLRFGLIRPVTKYVATEAGPAIEYASASVGRGVMQGLGAGGGIPVRIEGNVAPAISTVKVKCRNCGYLESEDATYCSKCGKPV